MDMNYGPLAALAGTWIGDKGSDIAPSDDRGTENNLFREELILTPIGVTQNHEQTLYTLRYSTRVWRLTEENTFHEETGYWLWDPAAQQVMKSFIVPRGIVVLAGGYAKPNAREFQISASLGSSTFGICSNPFLDVEFKTVKYDLKVTIHDENNFSYESDTQLLLKGRTEIFHHTDRNTLSRVK